MGTTNKDPAGINAKLLQFQKLVEERKIVFPKNAHNKFANYHYTTLDKILDLIRPLMAELNLIFKSKLTHSETLGGATFIGEVIDVDSGEKESAELPLSLFMLSHEEELQFLQTPAGEKKSLINRAQTIGSIITYLRRYSLLSILNIVGDEDADAADNSQKPASNQKPAGQQASGPTSQGSGSKSTKKANDKQVSLINRLISEKNLTDKTRTTWLKTYIFDAYKVKSINGLLSWQASELITKLQESVNGKSGAEAKPEPEAKPTKSPEDELATLRETVKGKIAWLGLQGKDVEQKILSPYRVKTVDELTKAQCNFVIGELDEQIIKEEENEEE